MASLAYFTSSLSRKVSATASAISYLIRTSRTMASSTRSTLKIPICPVSDMPDNSHFPGVNLDGYTLTKAIEKPGPTKREGVLIEWTAKNRPARRSKEQLAS